MLAEYKFGCIIFSRHAVHLGEREFEDVATAALSIHSSMWRSCADPNRVKTVKFIYCC